MLPQEHPDSRDPGGASFRREAGKRSARSVISVNTSVTAAWSCSPPWICTRPIFKIE
jgi:hypothetical protein